MAVSATQPTVPARRGVRRGLRRSDHRALLLAGDAASLALAVVVSLWTWSITAGSAFSPAFLREHALWFAAIPLWLAALLPSYHLGVASSTRRTTGALARALVLLLAGYLLLYFYAPRDGLPRLVALYLLWEGALFILAWRLTYIWGVTTLASEKRVLIVGADGAGRAIAGVMREMALPPTRVVGFIDANRGLWDRAIDGIPVVGGPERLRDVSDQCGVAEIVVASANDATGVLLPALAECQEQGIEVGTMTQVYEDLLWRIPVAHLQSDWLLTSFVGAVRAKDASRIAQRLMDVAGAALGLLALLVLGPMIALAVSIDSGRPTLFRQIRVGRGGAPFELLKFRTMVPDAERDGSPQWAGPRDHRVTRVGRFLRRARLDELPNFLNVLRGEMSLVGPRPERPEFVAQLEQEVPFYRTRLLVRPGITGWAQVNHPYGDSIRGAVEKLEYDLYYVKHRSLLFDMWILARTIKTVLSLGGR